MASEVCHNNQSYDGQTTGDRGVADTKRGHYRQQSAESRSSIVDDLLFEIYERWHYSHRDSLDSDTFTEYSSAEVLSHSRHSYHWAEREDNCLSQSQLQAKSIVELRSLLTDLQHRANQLSAQLIKQLKRRDRQKARIQKNSDVVTAILQAASQKRRIDANMKFSIQPFSTEGAFDQWCDAMKAVTRLPLGIPDEFRKKVWLALADSHLRHLQIDWESTVKFAFNERSNPDDNALGLQIVKDLHRTGCSGFSGRDNEEDRAVLKRVLLGYARWNKHVGYCQGFNVLAALILEVVDRREEDALKVMIYLIDHVLPENFFSNNLQALSVDMAVFRDLLRLKLPKLSQHLDHLQTAARDNTTGANYEPPLTNVFTMQWFLTLFATCLPEQTVLRVWDSVFLEGSEILLRTALAIWGRLAKRILQVTTADQFYCMMGTLSQEMLDDKIIRADSLVKVIYSMAPMPLPQLSELREKYTYNITPFTAAMNKRKTGDHKSIFSEEELDDEDLMNVSCFTGIMGPQVAGTHAIRAGPDPLSLNADVSHVSPGAYAASTENVHTGATAMMERMTTDLTALRKQYQRLRERQKQAHIIIANANARHQSQHGSVSVALPKMELPVVVNHLFMGKQGMGHRNKKVTVGPRIATVTPSVEPKQFIRSRHSSVSSQRSVEMNNSNDNRETLETRLEHIHVQSEDGDSEERCSTVSPPSDRKSSIDSSDSNPEVNGDVNVNNVDTVVNGAEEMSVACSDDIGAGDTSGEVWAPLNTIDEGKTPKAETVRDDESPALSGNEIDNVDTAGEVWTPLNTVEERRPSVCVEDTSSECNNNWKSRSNSEPAQLEGDSAPTSHVRPNVLAVSPRRASHTGLSPTHQMDSRMAEYVTKLTYKAHKKTFKDRDDASGGLSPPPSSPIKSPTSPKYFNPFPKSHVSESRARNGIRLGLYKPLQETKTPVKGNHRSLINSIQRQAEVKGNKGSKW